MRERTTWNAQQIKQAAMARTADPYLMNQDHVQQQPAADKYVIGDPSSFAEDVNTDNRWEDEYKGGQVNRNDIGEPNFLPNTFNHPEKTAAMDESTMLKKANLCVRTARLMLPKTASEMVVEDQATSLMHMPDYDLIETFTRLADDQEVQDEEQQQKQAQDQQEQEEQEQQQKQAQGQDFQHVSQQQIDQMVAQAVQQSQQQQQAQQQQAQQQQAQQQQQGQQQAQQQQQVAQQQQQVVSQQQVQQMIAQAVQQALQGQGQQQQQAGQIGDISLDPIEAPVEDIQLDGSSMGMDEVQMSPGEDDMLRQLFANEETQAQEEQQAQGQQQEQQKQATIRTASTRTVGTRPSAGVARLGGLGAQNTGNNEAAKLASLWTSAPDVSEAFGCKR